MPSPRTGALRQRLDRELLQELGEAPQLVSLTQQDDHVLRGVAICSGRVLSFVLRAEEQRLRTRSLFALLRHVRQV